MAVEQHFWRMMVAFSLLVKFKTHSLHSCSSLLITDVRFSYVKEDKVTKSDTGELPEFQEQLLRKVLMLGTHRDPFQKAKCTGRKAVKSF